MPKEEFKREVEKELTGRETEPHEIIYFKLYKSQIPVVEQAIETAGLMLGTDKSRGYCLEMICADFLAGANLDNGDPQILLQSTLRVFKFLPTEQKAAFLQSSPKIAHEKRSVKKSATQARERRVRTTSSTSPRERQLAMPKLWT
jgi:hypothetical protein